MPEEHEHEFVSFTPDALRLYNVVIDVAFAVSIVYFIILTYLILKKSSVLKEYRWHLLRTTVCAILFELFLFLDKPVFLFPALAFYFDGLVGNGNGVVHELGLIAVVSAVTNTILSIFATLMFRYRAIAASGWRLRLRNPCFYRSNIGVTYTLVYVGVAGMCFLLIPDKEVRLEFVNVFHPELESVLREHPTLMVLAKSNQMTTNLTIFAYAMIGVVFVLSVFLVYEVEVLMRPTQGFQSTYTMQLQRTLRNVTRSELLAANLFVFVPFFVCLLAIQTRYKHANYVCNYMLAYGAWYPVVLYSLTIYFIKPFRVWLVSAFPFPKRSNKTSSL